VLEYLVVCLTALTVSTLTLFSGFGLGTLLMPAFALFFPVEVAVAQTALVHVMNNLFKFALFRKRIDWPVALRFGLPACLASLIGARLLLWLSSLPPLASYTLGSSQFQITVCKVTVAVLMAGFALLETGTGLRHLAFDRRWLPAGGLLSGFFGGLSGHQGAFRSAFLVRSGLDKEAFIATGVAIAVGIDLVRLGVYARLLDTPAIRDNLALIATATLAAFVGAWLGRHLVKKMTLLTVQRIVAALLLLSALLLGFGIV